jgi:hypothetical protein
MPCSPDYAPSAHGAFLAASVECATIAAVGAPLYADAEAALRLGALVEGHVRSWSNVVERLHHSSSFYVLLSPARLLCAPAYMPAAALLAVGPLLRACAAASRGSDRLPAPAPADWAHAALVAAAVYGACALALVGIATNKELAGPAALLCWLSLLWACTMAVQRLPARLLGDSRQLRDGPWLPLLALVQFITGAWLLRSVAACCALALPAGLLLAPLCLACRPARHGTHWALLAAAASPAVLSVVGALLGCPPQHALLRLRDSDSLLLPLLVACVTPCVLLCTLVVQQVAE